MYINNNKIKIINDNNNNNNNNNKNNDDVCLHVIFEGICMCGSGESARPRAAALKLAALATLSVLLALKPGRGLLAMPGERPPPG